MSGSVQSTGIVVLGCGGAEELCQGKIELVCMHKEDMEFAMPCAWEG